MLKKRIIFVLLYCDGYFIQSRNFQIQKVGDIDWLKKNYDIKNISRFIDELVVLDISRNRKNEKNFLKTLQELGKDFLTPISAGGGINTFLKASNLLSGGADKVVINTSIFNNQELLSDISENYGEQSIIASLDFKKIDNDYFPYIENGKKKLERNPDQISKIFSDLPVGEFLINSIDKDGTVMGLDFDLLKVVKKTKKPIILLGGCGNADHIEKGLDEEKINAVATANLFNFIADGLEKSRAQLLSKNYQLPKWTS